MNIVIWEAIAKVVVTANNTISISNPYLVSPKFHLRVPAAGFITRWMGKCVPIKSCTITASVRDREQVHWNTFTSLFAIHIQLKFVSNLWYARWWAHYRTGHWRIKQVSKILKDITLVVWYSRDLLLIYSITRINKGYILSPFLFSLRHDV